LISTLHDKHALFYCLVLEQTAGDVNAPSQGDAAALAETNWALHKVRRYSVEFTVVNRHYRQRLLQYIGIRDSFYRNKSALQTAFTAVKRH